MSKIALEGNASGTGTFTIAGPNTNTNYTITLPQETGTLFTTGATTGLNASALSTGTVAVARGGTGAATLTSNNVIIGNGTSAVTFVAPGTTGNVLSSNGSAWLSSAITGTITTTTGSPLYYGARAWVNFNGVPTVSIRASANVSSITDNAGNGNYTINFSTSMPDADYVVVGSGKCNGPQTNPLFGLGGTNQSNPATGSVVVITLQGSTDTDLLYVMAAIFR